MRNIHKKISYWTCLFISSCIFSNDEIQDYHVVGSFYISSFANKNTLLYKSSSDLKLVGSGNVILENVDSIGYNRSKLIAVFKNQYFLIDSTLRNIENKYNTYEDLLNDPQKIEVKSFQIKEVSQKHSK